MESQGWSTGKSENTQMHKGNSKQPVPHRASGIRLPCTEVVTDGYKAVIHHHGKEEGFSDHICTK